MRKIKFRAWDKVDKKVREVMSLDFYNTRQSEATLASDSDVYLRYFEQVELMQYTGLKDKNGKEIYEGDIVKTVYKTGCVEYCEKQARYNIYLKSKDRLNEMNFMKNMADECEVIGNIYETREIAISDLTKTEPAPWFLRRLA